VLEMHKGENDIDIVDTFIFDGVTILGYHKGTKNLLQEGIEGAHLKLIEFTNSEKFVKFKEALTFAYNQDVIEEVNDNEILRWVEYE
jgi:hypothetical protein